MQIGREDTPEQYIDRLVEVFHELKRVLRSDGTLWLNIADTYCGTGSEGNRTDPKNQKGETDSRLQKITAFPAASKRIYSRPFAFRERSVFRRWWFDMTV